MRSLPDSLRIVGRGDGCDAVGRGDARVEKAELAEELEAAGREAAGRQAERREGGRRKQAVEGDVVDGEQARRGCRRAAAAVGGELQVGRQKAARPGVTGHRMRSEEHTSELLSILPIWYPDSGMTK